MPAPPKTLEALRKALLALGETIKVHLQIYLYDSNEPGHTYSSDTWFCDVEIVEADLTLKVNVSAKTPAEALRMIKAELDTQRKRMRSQRRIMHQPKLLEYKEA